MSAILGTHRSACLGFVIILLLVGLKSETPRAQSTPSQPGPFFISGRNVNTVGAALPAATTALAFAGDPLFKQQNEVDCDVSPTDARLVLCATNDYRGIEAFGDSWIGVTMSDDGGLTWRSGLHPGYPADKTAQIGAADPIVATVPGLGLIGYITISRLDERGTLTLGRWGEHNRENGERYTHLDSVVIGSGTPGRFADKPAMAVVLNPAGGTTTIGGRSVPAGVIHFGYALFPGNANNSSSEIYHLMSTDYGATWSNPKKLSESLGINQGIDLAVDTSTKTVVATWRRVKDTNEPDAIMFARSTDGGKTWSKAAVLSLGVFFDQDSSDSQFRTRSMPSIVHDGAAFHVVWSARVKLVDAKPVYARVLESSSPDGAAWSPAALVADNAGPGHQLMPTAAVAGGRVQVNWIDSRNNRQDSFRYLLDDFVYDDPASSTGKSVYRQSVDVFAAQASSGAALAFGAAQQVSRYRTGLVGAPPNQLRAQLEYDFINARLFKQGAWPFHGDYHVVASRRYLPNPDPDPEVAKLKPWVPNTAASDSHAVFYSAFTDNRDVRGYVWLGPASTPFTPTGTTMQGEPGTDVPAACVLDPKAGPDDWTPGNSPRSRDQNVYAAAMLPGLLVDSASGSKPAGALQRAYVVIVYNLTPEPRRYTLSIATPPAGVTASWQRCEAEAGCSPVTDFGSPLVIRGRSSVSRTVYVVSAEARPRIVVNVAEVDGLGQTGSVILNADPSAPQIEEPDGGLASILTSEIYEPDILGRQTTLYASGLPNPEVVPVPSVTAPRIEYPRIEYPRIEYDAMGNPRIEYPRIEYPRIEYDAVGNPRIEYPRIEYPRIEYRSIENPRIEYTAIAGDVTEITWPVTTDGANTTTAMTAKVYINGGLPDDTDAQVLVTVPYTMGIANSCTPGDTSSLVDSQVIVDTVVPAANIVATEEPPDTFNPPYWQPSFPVKPGQTVWVTLRIRGIQDANLARHAGLWVRSQPDPAANDNLFDEDRDGGIDQTPPSFDEPGSVIGQAEATSPAGAVVTYTVTARDGLDAAPVVTCAPGSGSTFDLGDTVVRCTATDRSGNSASATFIVNVYDKTPPVISNLPVPIAAEATGAAGAVVTYKTPTATDVVDTAPTVTCLPASGSTFAVGTTTVTCTATDASDNTSSASFVVKVQDTTPPAIGSAANIVAEATSAAGAAVTYTRPGATDLVDPAPTVSCSPASGSTFPIGTTTVVCTATDRSSNAATTSFTVTVRDTTPPAIVEAATPTTLIWSPNKILTPVTVEGRIIDATLASAAYRITDEYGTYSTAELPIKNLGPDGRYSFTIYLEAWRAGTDSDGRLYEIFVTAVDVTGNARTVSVKVWVPHNS